LRVKWISGKSLKRIGDANAPSGMAARDFPDEF
jgi:hypothetical protein